MSQAVIFTVGIVVFAVTVWGTVMAGGYWMSELAEAEDDQVNAAPSSPPPPSSPDVPTP